MTLGEQLFDNSLLSSFVDPADDKLQQLQAVGAKPK